MNATKLTLIALSAAAIMLAGCSNDNSLLNPVSDVQSGIGIDRAGRSGDSDAYNKEPELFTINAVVQKLDVESGCFYLESEEGKTFTPITPTDLVLEPDLKLKAEGYIDEHVQLFCGNGPAFVIKNYTILSRPKMSDDLRDSGITSGNQPASGLKNPAVFGDKKTEKDPGVRTVEGLVKITKNGCTLIETIANEEYVLEYNADIVLNTGDQVRATGNVSVLDVVTCYAAPLFVAETISINNPSKESSMFVQPGNELTPLTTTEFGDDQLTRPDDQSVGNQSTENEEGRKKKSEEERNKEGNTDEGP